MGEGSYSSDTSPADTRSISVAASLVILAPFHLLQFIPCCLRLNSQKLGSAYATAPLKNFKGFPFSYRIKLKPFSLVFKTLCNFNPILSLALTSLETLGPALLLDLLLFPFLPEMSSSLWYNSCKVTSPCFHNLSPMIPSNSLEF